MECNYATFMAASLRVLLADPSALKTFHTLIKYSSVQSARASTRMGNHYDGECNETDIG